MSPNSVVEQEIFEVGESLSPYVDLALARLTYLHPDIRFSYRANRMLAEIAPDQVAPLRREAAYALYREKIAAETHDIRRALFASISSGQ